MRHRFLTLTLAGWMFASPGAIAPRYVARRAGDVVHLEDAERQTRVSILPAVGNNAFAMTVKGHDVLHWPHASVEEFKAKRSLSGTQGRPFICFEPMAGITNALNLAHKGLYKDLESVPPGGTWQERRGVRCGAHQ